MRFYQETMKLPFLRDVSDLTPVSSSPATKLTVLEVAEHLAWGSEQSAWPSTNSSFNWALLQLEMTWIKAELQHFPRYILHLSPSSFYPVWNKAGTWNFSATCVTKESCPLWPILLQLHYLVL